MSRPCEVCGAPRAGEKPRVRRLLFGDRLVALCDLHADRGRLAGAGSLAELRALFAEANGQRSQLERRSPLDRRVFPPRPEGRRTDAGRRATDDA